MEIIDPEQKQNYESRFNKPHNISHNNNGRIIGGLIIAAIGAFLLAQKMGIYIPNWIMSWPMLLVSIGLLIGAKHSFRPGGWMIAVLIGGVFLVEKFIPELHIKPYLWPIMLILIGLFLIMVPSGRGGSFRQKKKFFARRGEEQLTEDIIDSTSIFGGVKKNIISKNFKGGEVNVVFGGAEINLSQADIHGKVYLEVNQMFGGIKLIVPSNWQVQSETTAILGSVEDQRSGLNQNLEPDKILVIDGTSVFGGISIRSY